MSRLLAVLLLLLLPTSALAQGGGHHDPDVDALRAALRAAIEELRSIDDLIDAADSRSVQRELHRKVVRMEEILGDAQRIAQRSGRGHRPSETIIVVEERHPEPVVVIDAGPSACGHGDFQAVASAVDNESFSAGKLQVLRDAAGARWFNVDQVTTLIKLFTFGKDMVEAGVILHPRTVDRENWYRVYSAFTFDADKETLRKRVGG